MIIWKSWQASFTTATHSFTYLQVYVNSWDLVNHEQIEQLNAYNQTCVSYVSITFQSSPLVISQGDHLKYLIV